MPSRIFKVRILSILILNKRFWLCFSSVTCTMLSDIISLKSTSSLFLTTLCWLCFCWFDLWYEDCWFWCLKLLPNKFLECLPTEFSLLLLQVIAVFERTFLPPSSLSLIGRVIVFCWYGADTFPIGNMSGLSHHVLKDHTFCVYSTVCCHPDSYTACYLNFDSGHYWMSLQSVSAQNFWLAVHSFFGSRTADVLVC